MKNSTIRRMKALKPRRGSGHGDFWHAWVTARDELACSVVLAAYPHLTEDNTVYSAITQGAGSLSLLNVDFMADEILKRYLHTVPEQVRLLANHDATKPYLKTSHTICLVGSMETAKSLLGEQLFNDAGRCLRTCFMRNHSVRDASFMLGICELPDNKWVPYTVTNPQTRDDYKAVLVIPETWMKARGKEKQFYRDVQAAYQKYMNTNVALSTVMELFHPYKHYNGEEVREVKNLYDIYQFNPIVAQRICTLAKIPMPSDDDTTDTIKKNQSMTTAVKRPSDAALDHLNTILAAAAKSNRPVTPPASEPVVTINP